MALKARVKILSNMSAPRTEPGFQRLGAQDGNPCATAAGQAGTTVMRQGTAVTPGEKSNMADTVLNQGPEVSSMLPQGRSPRSFS